jgi:hypothetical protein
MSFTRYRRLLGVLLLLVSLALLCWGLWPLGRINQMIPLRPTDMQLPPPGSLLPVLAGFFCV